MTETLELPPIISTYLAAHDRRDADTALTAFTEDATVIDEGRAYEGLPAIANWLRRAASEYTYTTQLTGHRRIDADRWDATHHLEGNFPGGVVDLTFAFTLRDGRIGRLVIAP